MWRPDHGTATSFPLVSAQTEDYAAHLTGGDLPAGLQAAELGDGFLIRIPRPAAEVTGDMVIDLRRHLVTAGALPPVD